MRQIDTIVVHCSATPPSLDIGAEEIRDCHVNGNGWKDIGYHFVIKRNGECEAGRDIGKKGAHAKGNNKKTIGVCLVGGVSESDRKTPEANFTSAQYRALGNLIDTINCRVFEHDNCEALCEPLKVIGHRDVSKKACPSFNVQAFLSHR